MPTVVYQLFSWLLGQVDHGFSALKLLGSPKFFSRGWGDMAIAYKEQDNLFHALANNNGLELSDENIEWGVDQKQGHVTVQKAKFVSPIASTLPKEARHCHFQLVKSINEDSSSSDVYVIMLPATGEMNTFLRMQMAKQLAAKTGCKSLIVTAPFYAERKPPDQQLFMIDTISNLLLQSQGIIQETASLIVHLLKKSPRTKVVVTGFSWGAAMSSCSVATALLAAEADGHRMACVPYVGSASPVCLVDGVLESSIDLDALKILPKESAQCIKETVWQELYKTQLSVISCRRKSNTSNPNKLGVVKMVAARDDQFIKCRYVKEFVDQVQGMGVTSFECQWIPGGHVSAAIMRSWLQKKAIVAAIDELSKLE